MGDKRLFVVLNKADLKPASQLKEVAEQVAQTLENEGLDFDGISAYDSKKGKEVLCERLSLSDFLSAQNEATNLHKSLVARLYEVKATYEKAIKEKQDKKKAIHSQLTFINNNLGGLDDKIQDNLNRVIKSIQGYLEVDGKAKESLAKLEKTISAMKKVIDEIFGKSLETPSSKKENSSSTNDDERYAQRLEKSNENSKQGFEKTKNSRGKRAAKAEKAEKAKEPYEAETARNPWFNPFGWGKS